MSGIEYRIESVLLAVVLLLAGCSAAPRVDVARAPETDFSRYETFTFHRPLGTDREEGTRTILSQHLEQAARSALEARGYRYVDSGADLRVNFFVETREVIEERRSQPRFSVGYGMYHRHYGVWTGYEPEVRQYTRGTLHVDVVDAGRDQLVWEGITQAQRPDGEFAFEPERARAAVQSVFADFPRR